MLKKKTRRLFAIMILTLMVAFSFMSMVSGATNLTLVSKTQTTVELSWDVGTSPYTLEISDDGGSTYITLSSAITQETQSVSGLIANTTYTFKVTDSTPTTPLTSTLVVTTNANETPSGIFSDMLSLAISVLPWFVVIMLINALINKVK